MKVLFKNTTKYTKQSFNSFIEFHSNKFGKKELLKIILTGVCILYIFIFNIIYKNWALLLGMVLIALIVYMINKAKLKKAEKSKTKLKVFTFYFYEKHIKIKYKRNSERIRYFQLYKIYETEEYFFLYLDKNHSLVLDKAGFEIGTSKEFSRFIKNKCPFKYKN